MVELEYCVEHVPVEVGNIVKYVNLDTNMLIPHSLVIPCSKLFPLVVQDVSGKWFEFRQRVTEIPAPTMIQHKDGQMTETLIHELFTASQLQSWDEYYSFPHFSESVHARTMMAACIEENCIQQDLSGSSSYSLSSFQQSLEQEAREALDPFVELERVWSLYIKGLSIFLGVMYLLVGALIVLSILQYGLWLAWRFALARLLLDVYGLQEFSQRNRMVHDLADAGTVPLMEGWLAQDI